MTAIDLKTAAARGATVIKADHAPVGPCAWIGIIIGGVLGLISGMAQGNALYTGKDAFLMLLTWTVGGLVGGSAIAGLIGGLIDRVRSPNK